MTEDHAFPPHSERGEARDVHLFCRQRASVAAMLKRTLGIFLTILDFLGMRLLQIPGCLTHICQRGG